MVLHSDVLYYNTRTHIYIYMYMYIYIYVCVYMYLNIASYSRAGKSYSFHSADLILSRVHKEARPVACQSSAFERRVQSSLPKAPELIPSGDY